MLNHYKVDIETKAELYKSGSLYVNETISTPASHERIMRFKEGSLIKEGVPETIYIKALSDGEHQLIHTIGLCLLFRHESALFLLDEPETHLNPDWRASYISTLRAALEADSFPIADKIMFLCLRKIRMVKLSGTLQSSIPSGRPQTQ
jgi:translation initiation factor RLI1